MTAFTEEQAAAFAWVYAATLVEPGQFGTYWTPAFLCAADLMAPMACCCTPRRVSLAMAKGDSANDEDGAQDRSDFTREAFGGI